MLSLSVYELPAGADDPQQPHAEEEVYYVAAGRAMLEVDGEQRPVERRDVVFLAAEVPHKFAEIEDDLTLLVVFAPAKSR